MAVFLAKNGGRFDLVLDLNERRLLGEKPTRNESCKIRMMETKKNKRRYEPEEPVSLDPLTFREALAALVRVKPEDLEEGDSSDQGGEGEGQDAKSSEGGK